MLPISLICYGCQKGSVTSTLVANNQKKQEGLFRGFCKGSEYNSSFQSYLSKIASTDALITQLQGLVYELRGQLNGQNYALTPDKVQTSGPLALLIPYIYISSIFFIYFIL